MFNCDCEFAETAEALVLQLLLEPLFCDVMNRTGSLYCARPALYGSFKPTSRRIHLFPSRHSPASLGPNPGLHLDPALQQLLRDTDLSLIRSRKHQVKLPRTHTPKELEGIPVSSKEDAEAWEGYELEPDVHDRADDVEAWHNRAEKLSPEALFGSKRIGQISIPLELETNMQSLINGTNFSCDCFTSLLK